MTNELDLAAFWTLSYGLYIVSACDDGKLNGQISNTVFQITDQPAQICVSINKTELTHEFIQKSGKFGVTVLDQQAPMKLIGLFGFKSGREVDKLSQVNYKNSPSGCPLVTDHAVALLEAKVINQVDVGTHTLFVGEVTYTESLKKAEPMTYAYYHQVKRGKSPENSPISKLPSEKAQEKPSDVKGTEEMKKYVCNVCGYVYDPEVGDPDSGINPGTKFEDIPDDWVCPICGVGKEDFSAE